jgi:hypothetical protein
MKTECLMKILVRVNVDFDTSIGEGIYFFRLGNAVLKFVKE